MSRQTPAADAGRSMMIATTLGSIVRSGGARKRLSASWMGKAASRRSERVRRMLMAAAILALVAPISGRPGHARDRMPGDVERVKMIGFTVVDLDRETEFFTKVLQFEKISDFRVVGTDTTSCKACSTPICELFICESVSRSLSSPVMFHHPPV